MHFLETYALNSGLKIDKPFIFEKYYPTEFNDYIVFTYEDYEYFQDVIDIITPYLGGTKIVHIRTSDGLKFENCHEINDANYSQTAYLIGRSRLFFGEPSLFSDLASYYKVKTVTLYSNTFPQNSVPYWNMKEDFEVLIKTDKKPSFNSNQGHRALNLIKPEEIAKKILNALNIEHEYNYETVYIGNIYNRNDVIIEIVPDNNEPTLMDNPNCSVRMDLKFDEEYLYKILQLRPLQIWTDKPIRYEILESQRHNIQQVFYIIGQKDTPSFAKDLKNLSIRTKLVTVLEKEALNSKKLDYVDHDPIIDLTEETDEFKGLPINNLFYSSCKAIYENGVYYSSDYAREKNITIKEPFEIHKFEDDSLLKKDLGYFKILSKQC